MKATPLGDKIVVKLFPEPRAYTASKLLIVSQDESSARWGKVLDIGPEAFRVVPGQEVCVNTVLGRPFGQDTLILPDSAVLLTREYEEEE